MPAQWIWVDSSADNDLRNASTTERGLKSICVGSCADEASAHKYTIPITQNAAHQIPSWKHSHVFRRRMTRRVEFCDGSLVGGIILVCSFIVY